MSRVSTPSRRNLSTKQTMRSGGSPIWGLQSFGLMAIQTQRNAAPHVGARVAAFFLAGTGYAFQQSLERAFVADIAPLEVRCMGFGVLASVNGVGDLVSSAIVGGVWTLFSPRLAFLFALVMTAAGAMVTSYSLRQSRARPGS